MWVMAMYWIRAEWNKTIFDIIGKPKGIDEIESVLFIDKIDIFCTFPHFFQQRQSGSCHIFHLFIVYNNWKHLKKRQWISMSGAEKTNHIHANFSIDCFSLPFFLVVYSRDSKWVSFHRKFPSPYTVRHYKWWIFYKRIQLNIKQARIYRRNMRSIKLLAALAFRIHGNGFFWDFFPFNENL